MMVILFIKLLIQNMKLKRHIMQPLKASLLMRMFRNLEMVYKLRIMYQEKLKLRF